MIKPTMVNKPDFEYPRFMVTAQPAVGLNCTVWFQYAWHPAKILKLNSGSIRCHVKGRTTNVGLHNVRMGLRDITDEYHVYPPKPDNLKPYVTINHQVEHV